MQQEWATLPVAVRYVVVHPMYQLTQFRLQLRAGARHHPR
ncbi:hypothetical protein FORC066_2886 [Yersinia enterocolitica]|nr:hypothetical protein FORC066_2886 [Yersinia enterocolitica]